MYVYHHSFSSLSELVDWGCRDGTSDEDTSNCACSFEFELNLKALLKLLVLKYLQITSGERPTMPELLRFKIPWEVGGNS